jgi:hypothetical protein
VSRPHPAISTALSLEDEPFFAAVQSYVHNLLVSTRMRRLEAQDIDVLEDVPTVVGLALSADCKCPTCDKHDDDLDFKGRHLARHLRAYLRQSSKPQRIAHADEPVRSNLAVVAKSVGLGDIERQVLTFFIALHSDAGLKRMTERFGEVTLSRAAEIVAVAARLPIPKVFAAIGSGGRLLQSGLLGISNDRSDLDSKFELKSELLDLVSAPSLDRDALLARFVEAAPPSTLTAQDFAPGPGVLGRESPSSSASAPRWWSTRDRTALREEREVPRAASPPSSWPARSGAVAGGRRSRAAPPPSRAPPEQGDERHDQDLHRDPDACDVGAGRDAEPGQENGDRGGDGARQH